MYRSYRDFGSSRIPDITERFPEGFNGVDMTPSFYGEPVDQSRSLGHRMDLSKYFENENGDEEDENH